MEIKKLDKSMIEIKNAISWKEWQNFFDEVVANFSKEIKIEGFRAGKAPRKIVEQKAGKEAILNAVAEKAIQKYYPKTLKKEKIEAIGYPQVQILKLVEGEDLEYLITTAVMPEVKIKNWQKKIKEINKKYKEREIKVSKSDIEKELEKLANSRAKLVTVKRSAKNGDAVKVDFQVKKDNVPIEGGTAKDHSLILGKNVFIPGFEEKIVGMKEGEEKEFELVFPKEYHEKNLAGKPAKFEVKLKLVQERSVPKIDDTFATSLGKFENLKMLKSSIQKGLKREKEMKQKEEQRSEFAEKLSEEIDVLLPEILVHEELHKMLHEFEEQTQRMGVTVDQYLKQMGKTKEDLEKDWKPQAEKRIKSALAFGKIITEKELDISGENIEKEMNKTLQYYKNEKNLEDKLDMKALYEHTKAILLNEELFKMLEKM
ncbi:MAG TPA: trigger factor [Candidatus Moranbacteria bacterium]|nr:trigger factor [Candidatus Moranbacteria bacterium]